MGVVQIHTGMVCDRGTRLNSTEVGCRVGMLFPEFYNIQKRDQHVNIALIEATAIIKWGPYVATTAIAKKR